MHPPDVEWTPRACKQVRTPLPSTRVRVSPSPNKGNSGLQGSPIITVSTTTTPIQPLQGNKKKYVIVQGNNRHLKGLASHRHNFYTRTVEESHQPIYLQGKTIFCQNSMLTVELKWSYSGCILWDQVIRFVVIITVCYMINNNCYYNKFIIIFNYYYYHCNKQFFDSYVFYFKTSISHLLSSTFYSNFSPIQSNSNIFDRSTTARF